MLGADARHLGFLVDVARGLLLVLLAQDWRQIGLPVLAAIDQGTYVIDVPAVAGGDFTSGRRGPSETCGVIPCHLLPSCHQ